MVYLNVFWLFWISENSWIYSRGTRKTSNYFYYFWTQFHRVRHSVGIHKEMWRFTFVVINFKVYDDLCTIARLTLVFHSTSNIVLLWSGGSAFRDQEPEILRHGILIDVFRIICGPCWRVQLLLWSRAEITETHFVTFYYYLFFLCPQDSLRDPVLYLQTCNRVRRGLKQTTCVLPGQSNSVFT